MSSKKRRSNQITCLVAGFGPFGDETENSSELIASNMPAQVSVGDGALKLAVTNLILPTCCQAAWKKLKTELKRSSPQVLIMLGLAGGRKQIEFERFALNIRDYPIADVNGHRPVGERISKKGATAYETSVNLLELQRFMQEHGVETNISNYGGAFVCNDLYYRALKFQSTSDSLKHAQFIHVPRLSQRSKAGADDSSDVARARQLEKLTAAVVLAAGRLAWRS